jgi:uracil-DNA glycosylase
LPERHASGSKCARARELIPGRDVRPGIDYALTEAVRCKSRGEHGVEEALETCSDRYLRRTLELSGAEVVVVLGRIAARAVQRHLGVSRDRVVHEGVLVGRRPRAIVFLPHPNARTARSLDANVRAEQLERLRVIVARCG